MRVLFVNEYEDEVVGWTCPGRGPGEVMDLEMNLQKIRSRYENISFNNRDYDLEVAAIQYLLRALNENVAFTERSIIQQLRVEDAFDKIIACPGCGDEHHSDMTRIIDELRYSKPTTGVISESQGVMSERATRAYTSFGHRVFKVLRLDQKVPDLDAYALEVAIKILGVKK